MNTRNQIFTVLFLCFCVFLSANANAADCRPCADLLSKISANLGRKTQIETIRQKNQDYFAKLEKDDVSKRVKVNSNILIATLQIETLENQLGVQKKEFETKGCHECKLLKK